MRRFCDNRIEAEAGTEDIGGADMMVVVLVLLLLLLIGKRRGKVRKTPYLNTPQQNTGKMNTHEKTKTHHGRNTDATPN